MISELLKRIKENWQILATLLVAWSVFDLYNYYISFGIEIQSYISIGEILLLVFPSILNGLIAILLIIIFFGIGLRNRKKINDPRTEKIIKAIDEDKTTLFNFKETVKFLIEDFKPFKIKNIFSITISIISILLQIGMLLFIIYVGYSVYILFSSESIAIYPLTEKIRFAILSFITLFFLSPVFFLLSEYFEKYAHRIFSTLTISKKPIIYFIVAFIFNSILSNRMQYISIINGYGNKKVTFTYSEKKIETDSSFVYIGSTQSYVFIRNNVDSLSLIFKKEEIKDLTIKNISVKK